MDNEKLGKITDFGDPNLDIEWVELENPPGWMSSRHNSLCNGALRSADGLGALDLKPPPPLRQ